MEMNEFTRRGFLKACIAGAMAGSLPGLLGMGRVKKKLNVLFIAVDDLRPQLGCYGDKNIISPNIDRLASKGVLFERAYCQQAICMASRASLMSGYRPDKGKIYMNGPLYEHVPDALPLNKYFMNNGYETISIGKIYHHRSDEKVGWSKEAFHLKDEWLGRSYLPEKYRKFNKDDIEGRGPAFCNPDVADNLLPDGICAEEAIKELNRLKDKQFFLAVGFFKPHLPFNSPKKYWDMYSHDKIELAKNRYFPKDMPPIAGTTWGELRHYYGIPQKGDLTDDMAKNLIHAYYACVSYVDAMIGKVLDELERLKLSDKTVVVLWGDHGWKLGEHNMWSKHTNFELDTNSTLIIRAPGMKGNGSKTKALTEFVDIYPTLCDLCGLEKPKHLEGTSMAGLLKNPDRQWKKAAFSQYPKNDVMGYSMRTDKYRYTEWQKIEDGEVVAVELYDHSADAEENINVVGQPQNKKLVKSLSKMLAKGWKGALP